MDEQTAGTGNPRPTARLVVDVVRALRGWVVAAAGGVLLLGCYLGVSKETDVALQLPYVVSGGFGGLALVLIGSALLVADRFEAAQAAQARTVGQVDDLHSLIIAAATVGEQVGGELPTAPAQATYQQQSAAPPQNSYYNNAAGDTPPGGSARPAGVSAPGPRA
ncbi:transporter [Frankia sp. AiPs1]|uniref:transporter n=1 Tax=Frankia sp. AiPs1 TaxID=573493 RepID=UPI002044AE26|nr:transporter [Frankia sp. AiPs1]MCM3922023.1 transporter [Frankia sp. AiPs1]